MNNYIIASPTGLRDRGGRGPDPLAAPVVARQGLWVGPRADRTGSLDPGPQTVRAGAGPRLPS